MPAGIQCWAASGNVQFDTTTRTGRVFGSFAMGPDQVAQVAVPVGPGKVPWAIVYASGNIRVGYDFNGGVGTFESGNGLGTSSGVAYVFYGER